jgi:signal transduction histidine kinase
MTMLAEMSADALSRTRQYARDSFPVGLDAMNLKSSLIQICADMSGPDGFTCTLACSADPDDLLSRGQKINIYRIVQEALHNSCAHSRAAKASVEVCMRKQRLIVRIADDGIGFSAVSGHDGAQEAADSLLPGTPKRPRGLGLRSMKYRAHQIGADFSIESSPDGGTVVELCIPGKGDAE